MQASTLQDENFEKKHSSRRQGSDDLLNNNMHESNVDLEYRLPLRTQYMIGEMRNGERYTTPDYIAKYIKLFTEKTNCDCMLDLGSAGKVFLNEDIQNILKSSGLSTYVGVDLAFENGNRKESENSLVIISYRKEILDTLREMPNNYAHVHMCGLDSSIYKLTSEWGSAVINEVKRIVPVGGFFSTDDLSPVAEIFQSKSQNFAKFRNLVKERYDILVGSATKQSDQSEGEAILNIMHQLSEFKSKGDDIISNVKGFPNFNNFVFDMPEFGLRTYSNGTYCEKSEISRFIFENIQK